MISFFNVGDCVDEFTGRKKFLRIVHQYFIDQGNKFTTQVIAADGGLGKTQFILQYVYEYKQEYGSLINPRVYWIPAETESTMNMAMKELALKLSINVEGRTDKAILKDVHKVMELGLERTLLIFDNVESSKIIKSFLPPVTTSHHVLITTRNKSDWPAEYKLQILEPFDNDDAMEYLHSRLDNASDTEKTQLSNLFNNIPLLLSQAVAFIKQAHVSVNAYIKYYEKETIRRKQNDAVLYTTTFTSSTCNARLLKLHIHTSLDSLLEIPSKINKYESVNSFLTMILDSLPDIYSKAITLMRYFGYLNAEKIPVNIFLQLFTSETDLLKHISLIGEYKLITLHIDDNTQEKFISIHRLVQEVMRNKTKEMSMEIEVIAKLCSLISPQYDGYDTDALMKKTEPLLSHILSVISHYESYAASNNNTSIETQKDIEHAVAMLYLYCGKYYIEVSKYDEAMNVLTEQKDILNKYDNNNSDYATCLHNIARVYYDKEDYDKALPVYEESLRIRKQVFGDNHSDVAQSLNNIAGIYYSKRGYEKALPMYEESLRINKQVFGDNHSSVAYSLNNIASVYCTKGEYDKALSISEDSLRVRKYLYGDGHSDVADSLHNTAIVYKAKREYDRALSMYEESLGIYKQVYGDNHSSVATSLSKIASLYKAKGEYDKALPMYEESLRVNKQVFGDNHSSVNVLVKKISDMKAVLSKKSGKTNKYCCC